MKAIKFYFLFKIALIILTLCHFVAAVLNEREENIGRNEINTKFVNALQVSETNKRADFEDSDHKLKMSVVNSENPESRVNNFVYLLKHEELKGFLKTLPIEILRKLRTLASKDIDSAQKFVIRLAQERKKKWGDQGIAERLGMISEARAKPLISDNATTNPIDKDSIDSSNSTRRINSMSKFLRNYKFTPSIDNGNEESHNPWKPIAGAPSTTPDNSTTVTYIVHEVLHPKHPYLNHSTPSRVTSTTSTIATTEEYPSVVSPMTDPPPTPPMSVKIPNPNYRPTILHHKKPNDLQHSVDNSQKLLDNYYSGSRQHRGSKFKQLQDSLPQSQNSFNQNPTILLPHAPGGQYSWGIAPGVVDAHSYYINPTHLAANDQGPGLGDTPSDVQNMNNYNNYPDYPTLSYPYQGPWIGNTIPGYNIKNSFTLDSTRNSLPTHNMAHNNPPYSYQQMTIPVVQTNEANYHSNPNRSPANYYMLHAPPSNYYYNNELQEPSKIGHGHSHRGDRDYKYSSSDLHRYHGSGWTHTDDHSHESKGMLYKVKSYFYKGDRSAAEKVFEVSLGILAFLAFGGYLVMLIYQVFAATSVVPLFPLVTQGVPSNTGLFGILFGRNLDPKSSFNKYLNTQLDSLEKQVTIAFNNVISKFYIKEEDDNDNVHKKQNEL